MIISSVSLGNMFPTKSIGIKKGLNKPQQEPVPKAKNVFDIEAINPKFTQLNFKGVKIYIVDGGNHSTNLAHFAKAINKEIEPIIKDVKVLPEHPNVKYLKDLKNTLKEVGESCLKDNVGYIAIPASACVPLLNLQAQVNEVMDTNIELTPENIKTYKPLILDFFKKLYEDSIGYNRYIQYMDNINQGFKYVYPVIQEINKLTKKAKVYVPSGHPFDQTMKWMAEKRNLKPELYNYIATGKDTNGVIQAMQKEIKDQNWYNFNLLTLSDAKIVTIKNKGNNRDYIFAGYDTCTTDGERGVYNFTPIRDQNNKLLGYSYTNETTVEYPYDEFPANDEVANLVKYVGRPIAKVLASREETRQYLNGIRNENTCSKLYHISDIFTPEEIESQKLNLKGNYVDSTKKLFFRHNDMGKVIFPYTDCEGSGKPSVLPMWGCCFSVMNAIKRDIEYDQQAPIIFKHYGNSYGSYLLKRDQVMNNIMDKAREARNFKQYQKAEDIYNRAIVVSKISEKYGDPDITPYLEQGDMFLETKQYRKASGCFNTAIVYLCKKLKGNLEINPKCTNLPEVKAGKIKSEKYNSYREDLDEYYRLGTIARFFTRKPTTNVDTSIGAIRLYEDCENLYKKIQQIADIYRKIGITCENNGELESARKCYRAADEIANCTDIGQKLVLRRADHNRYIGDIIK